MVKLLIANWKMNPVSESKALKLVSDVKKEAGSAAENVKIVFCAPFVYLRSISEAAKGSGNFFVGAQNVFWENQGTFTGEVSAEMLKDLGCGYCIVGHSERRKYFGETLEDVKKKIAALLKKDIIPIICVGEDKKGRKLEGLEKQVESILKEVSQAKITKLIFVYEPAWAISDGERSAETPSSDDVLSAKILIQKCLTKKISRKKVLTMSILYGGSANAENIKKFVGSGLMDGALVGGASLKVKEFGKIINLC